MKFMINSYDLTFREIPLVFMTSLYSDVFATKNNKTLRETIEHKKYNIFKNIVISNYKAYLDIGLGSFVAILKDKGDIFYKEFLNKNGDKIYSQFYISDKPVQSSKGIYLYCVDKEVKYIGRCKDSFGKRINQGYGKVQPKNCYIDGQSTNCHLNSLITENKEKIKFYILELCDEKQIVELEVTLIKKYKPEWNKTF
ncbi:hypothetical protein MHH49_18030 [Paenibacillus sp. FSL F4-0122]|uniref:hypothetical protein n=1 Tax=Paenibacillus sp. FSL F4-0122 TaxID=2921371 RepID=UPI0030F9929E